METFTVRNFGYHYYDSDGISLILGMESQESFMFGRGFQIYPDENLGSGYGFHWILTKTTVTDVQAYRIIKAKTQNLGWYEMKVVKAAPKPMPTHTQKQLDSLIRTIRKPSPFSRELTAIIPRYHRHR